MNEGLRSFGCVKAQVEQRRVGGKHPAKEHANTTLHVRGFDCRRDLPSLIFREGVTKNSYIHSGGEQDLLRLCG